MSSKTRKYIWPVSLVMSLALVGVLAAFVALVPAGPQIAQAHDPCEGLTEIGEIATCEGTEATNPHTHGGDTDTDTDTVDADGLDVFTIKSSSNSASSTVELKVEITNLSQALVVGSTIELYLEDDYQVPPSIPSGAAYFIATPPTTQTGDGSPVLAVSPVIISTDDHYAGDDDYALQVTIPDMCPGTTSTAGGTGVCDGQNGLAAGENLTLVFSRAAGIKNPTEEKKYKVGAKILPLGTSTQPNSGPDMTSAATLPVEAKTKLSDDDNKRGYELIITGSGFNNGTTADAYVLQSETAPATCDALIANSKSTLVGSALVGSDDIAAVTVEVTVPTFGAGNINYICIVDGENRTSSELGDKIDRFKLEPSIRAVPSTVSSGDTVNVFAQDYPFSGRSLTQLKLAGIDVYNSAEGLNAVANLRNQPLVNGSATISFEVPGLCWRCAAAGHRAPGRPVGHPG